MKKLALILVFGLLLSLTAPFSSVVRAQDPAAADTLSQDDMAAPIPINSEEEGTEADSSNMALLEESTEADSSNMALSEESTESESSNMALWGGIAFIVVVGGYLVLKKSGKKK